MSKKLDEEYKAMITSEIPDLWDRIDANLREKKVASAGENSAAGIDAQTVTEKERTDLDYTQTATGTEQTDRDCSKNTQKPAKKKTIYKLIPWIGGIAAAALVFAIALPTMIFVGLRNAKSSNTEMAMATNAENTAMMQEAEDYDLRDGFGEVAYEDSAVTDDMSTSVDAIAAGKADLRDKNNYSVERVETAGGEYEKNKTLAPGKQESVTEAEETEAEIIYARVENVDAENNVTYVGVVIAAPDLLENRDDNLTLEVIRLEVSDASNESPETGGIYEVDFDGSKIILIKKVGQISEE